MAIEVPVGQPISITPAQAAANVGLTLETGDGWAFAISGAPIPGVEVGGIPRQGRMEGTPTTVGEYPRTLEETDFGDRYDLFRTPDFVLSVVAAPVDPDPDPDPDPVDPPEALPAAVAAFLRRPGDPETLAAAEATLPIMEAMARAYTRDRGFTDAGPTDGIRAVLITSTARAMANPDQIQSTLGSVTLGVGFRGFSLAEQIVLNRYRVRAR